MALRIRPQAGSQSAPIGHSRQLCVIDQGSGFFDFYAHLKSGSVAVKVGDTVVVQQLGQLATAAVRPHLHFHVVLGPSPVASNSVPYVFNSFQFAGTADPNDHEGTEGMIATGRRILSPFSLLRFSGTTR